MGRYIASSGTVAASVGALKTILQVAAGSADRLLITEIGVTFDGVNASAVPVVVNLQRQTTSGSGPGATITPILLDPADGAAHASAVAGPTPGAWTTEPTAGDILRSWTVPPTSGLILQFPLDVQPRVGLSGRIALTINAPAAVDAVAYIEWTE